MRCQRLSIIALFAFAALSSVVCPASADEPNQAERSVQVDALEARAKKLIVSEPGKAALLLEEAIELSPEPSASLHLNLAVARERLGDQCAALASYQIAIGLGVTGAGQARAERSIEAYGDVCSADKRTSASRR